MTEHSVGSVAGYVLTDATFKPYVVRQPVLISVSYTAVYDTGAVQFGAVVSDGSDKPLTVEFKNAKGSSSTL